MAVRFSRFIRLLLIASVLSVSVLGILRSRLELVLFQTDAKAVPTELVLPKANMIRPLLLGHEAFLADLIWIRMLGYFADELKARRGFVQLVDLIHLATDLDPRFEKIYIWAGAALIYNSGRITKEKILASNQVLEKGWHVIQNDVQGWRHDPDYWRIPQMIGFNYAMELQEKEKGAPYIAAVARIPESPALYKTWAATLFKRSGQVQEGSRVLEDTFAIETLRAQLGNVKAKEVKEQIKQRLEFYYQRLYGEHGRARLALLERLIMRRIRQWYRTFPYIDFDLFLLLRPEDPDNAYLQRLNLDWSAAFSNLGAVSN